MDALTLLKDDLLYADGVTINIPVLSKLTAVAQAIENYDDDESHAVIARELGVLRNLVGGAEHVHLLLPLLEKLGGQEEVSVRDNATKSLLKIFPMMSKKELAAKVLPLLKRLANGDWFATRITSCSLFAPVYPMLEADAKLSELRNLFVNLCNDDTPMVRKASSLNLGKFCTVVAREDFKADLLPVVKAFTTDDMEIIRTLTVDACYHISVVLEPAEFVTHVLPLVEALQDDQSWRVRRALALAIGKLMTQVKADPIIAKRVLPFYSKLLLDPEAEVRIAAVSQLCYIAKEMKYNKTVADLIAGVLDTLVRDPVPQVRVAFSRQLAFVLPTMARNDMSSKLVPAVKELAKDECVNVRWSVMDGLFPEAMPELSKQLKMSTDSSLSDLFSEMRISDAAFFKSKEFTSLINSLLSTITELARDRSWRVRLSVVNKSTMLFEVLGAKLWEKHLMIVLVAALSDHVFTVRECTCKQVAKVVSKAGADWAVEKLFPSAFSIYDKSNNYLHRMTCLSMVMKLNEEEKVESSVVQSKLYPIVSQAVDDDVANVRMFAAQCLSVIIPRVNAALQKKMRPQLQKLTKDKDIDVSYAASKALAALG